MLTKKSCVNKALRDLDDNLTKKAETLGIQLKNDKGLKRNVVSKCFNQIGISVPIDEENDIGYRPLTMTNSKNIHTRTDIGMSYYYVKYVQYMYVMYQQLNLP